MAGKKHVVPDTFSRRSDKGPEVQGDMTNSNVLPAYSSTMGPPDWVSSPIIASINQAPPPSVRLIPPGAGDVPDGGSQ